MPKPSIQRHRRKILYEDPYLKVAEHQFKVEGEEYLYYIKEEADFAVVGALTIDGSIIMVRQFRPGPARYCYDMPGGMVEPGDSPIETARKELLEETGYQGELEPITSCFPMAYSTARKHIFLARNCVKVAEPQVEANMIAEPLLVSTAEFAPLLRSGNLIDLDCALLLAAKLGMDY